MTYKRILWAAGAAALTVLLSGCIKLDMDLTVHSNDTVSGSVITGVSRQVVDLAGGEAAIRDQIRQSLEEADVPEGVEIKDYNDDKFIGVEASFNDITIQEFNSGPGSTTSTTLLTHTGGKFIVDATLPLSGEEFGAGELGSLAGTGEIKIAVTFPGRVLAHNGELDGTTVTWIGTLGEDLVMHAESEESGAEEIGGGSGGSVGMWIGIAALVAAAAAGVYFYLRSRRSGTPAVVTPGPDGTTGTIADYDAARPTASDAWPEQPQTSTLPDYGQATPAAPPAESGWAAPTQPDLPTVPSEPYEPPAQSAPAGEQGSGEQGTGEQGSDDAETGDQGSGDAATGQHPAHPAHPETNAVLDELDAEAAPSDDTPTDRPARED